MTCGSDLPLKMCLVTPSNFSGGSAYYHRRSAVFNHHHKLPCLTADIPTPKDANWTDSFNDWVIHIWLVLSDSVNLQAGVTVDSLSNVTVYSDSWYCSFNTTLNRSLEFCWPQMETHLELGATSGSSTDASKMDKQNDKISCFLKTFITNTVLEVF